MNFGFWGKKDLVEDNDPAFSSVDYNSYFFSRDRSLFRVKTGFSLRVVNIKVTQYFTINTIEEPERTF